MREQIATLEKYVKDLQIRKRDLKNRPEEYPGEEEKIKEVLRNIEEQIKSVEKILEDMKQKHLREEKFKKLVTKFAEIK